MTTTDDEHAWFNVTRFEDLPNTVEVCPYCGAVLVTAPPCATPEQVVAAEALAQRLTPPTAVDLAAASSTTNVATEDE